MLIFTFFIEVGKEARCWKVHPLSFISISHGDVALSSMAKGEIVGSQGKSHLL